MKDKPEGDHCEDNVMEAREGFCLLEPLMSFEDRLIDDYLSHQ